MHKPTRIFFAALLLLGAAPVWLWAADPGIVVDFSITKTGPPAVTAGSDVTYDITVVSNLVPGVTTADATVIDTLPAGWTVVSATPNQGTCAGLGTGVATCALGPIIPGGQVAIRLVAHSPALCQPTSATNTATVTTNGTDIVPGNNTAMVIHTVVQPSLGPGQCLPPGGGPNSSKPGSVLFFPLYASSASSANDTNTRVAITNTNPNRGIAIHLFFVDGSSCSVADSFVCLTPNQTVAFLMSDVDPGVSGYIIAVASDGPGSFGEGGNTGCPISFNFLIGHQSIKLPVSSSGGIGNTQLAILGKTRVETELEAESCAAEFGSPVPGCDASSPSAVLRFNGQPNGYNRLPRVLAASSIPSRADGNSTLLIINRIGGDLSANAATLGTLFGLLYDDAESAYSFSLTAGCQLRGTLSGNFPRTVPRIDTIIPAGRSGWLKIWGGADYGIVGATINNNVNTDSAPNAFDGGHLLHKLTLTDTAILTIPIFPPSC
jgi:uncharacterized repeat protein (TIGR01451 family)